MIISPDRIPRDAGQDALSGAGAGAATGAAFGPWGALIGAGIGAGAKLIMGANQRAQAKKLKPNDYLPPGALENNILARYMLNATTYPGQEQDQARNDQTTANAVGQLQKNAKSGTDILNSAALIQARGTKSNNDIAQRYQQFKQGALSRLMGSNQQLAGYQNQNQQQYLAAKSALLGAGLQNIYGGINDIGGGIAAASRPQYAGYGPMGGGGGYGGGWRGYGQWGNNAMGGMYQPTEQGFA